MSRRASVVLWMWGGDFVVVFLETMVIYDRNGFPLGCQTHTHTHKTSWEEMTKPLKQERYTCNLER